MSPQHARPFSRRSFLGWLTGVGTAGFLGLPSRWAAAEPPPETTTLRLTQTPAICLAPQYVAADLLRGEGFTDVQYVKTTGGGGTTRALASGEAHISMAFSGPLLIRVDAGDPIVLLGGIHVGCFELFGTERVRSIHDLKGKTVAYLGFPPDPQELRARRIGHVVVNSTMDRPWSQYFCCMVAGNREFVSQHPVATKRALRAILKATDLCAREPDRVAQLLMENGYTEHHDYALQTLQEIPYAKWREYDPEDTVRFYALRLHEAGMIKSGPQKLIAQGTDWRILNELKKELKG